MRQGIPHRVARAVDAHRVQPRAKPRGAIGGVIQACLRGVFRWQHHAAHVFRPDRVAGDGRDQGAVDAARHAQQHLAEARLAQVIPQAQHHRVVILLPRVGLRRHQAGLGAPAVGAVGEIDMHHGLLKGGQLHDLVAAGVQHEAGPVIDLVVLAADHVHIDKRQPGFHDAADHVAHAQVQLVAVIGAAVRHDQDLGPGLGQGLGHVRVPAVLADRAADAGRADGIGAADRAAVEQAQLIKQLLVGQVMLQHPRDQRAVPEHPPRVVQPPAVAPRAADADGGAAGQRLAQLHDRGLGLHDEGGLQHQVLGLVSGDEHLWQGQHVGACVARLLPGRAGACRIAGQVAHGGVQLADGQAKAVGHALFPCVMPRG